ncbi:M16 family metallopeptidase [Azohydromonas aeria]|uniref:M16 family metallopeptidase n=1 Tax=Azohydromonas aeria TaxID=2590212 RepID=UPI0012FB7E1F|nr:pitrilysin family protein [Azohydromonas aeria]
MPGRRDCLAALGALGALAALPAWAAAPPPPIRVPPLQMRERRLANGLQVLTLPDRSTATVSVQVWYRVGGKDDPPGRSGFAHLFEHMMFKGSRHMGAATFDRLTEDVGGSNNAFTAEDVTAYFSTVPSNHLERILWAEAERMGSLVIDQANFDSERAVVQEEYRQRVLAGPYGRLFNALPQHGYIAHPYKRPVIGSIEDLNAATLEDVRAFHATFYRPDNATLIVSGDFDQGQLDPWVDRYFTRIARPGTPIPRVTVQEPRRTESSRVQVFGPNVPLPAVALIWQGPRADHRDTAALHVASSLLSGGESSRLNESLVYREQSAQAAGFNTDFNADAGLLMAYAIAAGGREPAQLEQALLREIERLANKPIPDAELEKVRTQVVTGELAGRQTPHGRAQSVGWSVILRNDPRAADRELAELQAVRAADVQRVLKSYVLGRPRVTLDYTEKKA